MPTPGTLVLVFGGTLSAIAAVAHLACIVIGASAYRYMGAGEKMARAAEAGKSGPALVTLAIAGVLFVWAAYAFSGAGLLGELPFRRLALSVISAVFLVRAVAFPLLKPAFPENTQRFWLVSSGICLLIGALYLFGLVALWPTL